MPGPKPFRDRRRYRESQAIERRQQRQTYRQLAQALEIGQSTVARLLKREDRQGPTTTTSTMRRGIFCIWTSRSWGASSVRGIGQWGIASRTRQARARSMSVWPSTTIRKWFSAAFTLTRRAGVLAWLCFGPCATTPAWPFALSGCSPTTAPAIAPAASNACAGD